MAGKNGEMSRPPTGKTADASYRKMQEERERAANMKAIYLAHRDLAYSRSGLFKERVVGTDEDTGLTTKWRS
jgi:hypothetical protein